MRQSSRRRRRRSPGRCWSRMLLVGQLGQDAAPLVGADALFLGDRELRVEGVVSMSLLEHVASSATCVLQALPRFVGRRNPRIITIRPIRHLSRGMSVTRSRPVATQGGTGSRRRATPRRVCPAGQAYGGRVASRRRARRVARSALNRNHGRRRDPAELHRGALVVAVGPVLDHHAVAQAQPVGLRGGERPAGRAASPGRPGRRGRRSRRGRAGGPTSCCARRRGRPRRRPRGPRTPGRRTTRAATAPSRRTRPGRGRATPAARPCPRG